MKRLLLVSYEFPPKGGTQSQTVAKYARALSDRGWDVTVLTVADPPTSLLDHELLDEVADRVTILSAFSLEPTRLVQLLRDKRSSKMTRRHLPASAGSRGYTSAPRWLIALIRTFLVPDEKVGWTPWAVREGERAHAQRPFAAILSSGPPVSTHGVAWRLKRRLGIPWVAHMMDPICDGYASRPATPLHRALLRAYERKVVTRADAAAIATEGMRAALLARNPDSAECVSVVGNIFDPRDFTRDSYSEHGGFVISYVGAFQLTITPDVFLDALAVLVAKDQQFAHDVRVRFVGPRDPETERAVTARNLQELVERTGFVSHRDAIAAAGNSDVLLLVLGPEPAASDILTSKLPEYLATRRAVLALVPNGVAGDLVAAAGAGEVVAPTDVAGTASALKRLHEKWKNGSLPTPNGRVVELHSLDVQADKLDHVLRSVLS